MHNSTRRNLVIYFFCLFVVVGLIFLALEAGKVLDKALAPRGFLGISYNAILIIEEVVPNSPAENAGLMVGDRIVAINGFPAVGQPGLAKLISENPAGSTIKIMVLRKDKTDYKKMTFTATLIKRPQ